MEVLRIQRKITSVKTLNEKPNPIAANPAIRKLRIMRVFCPNLSEINPLGM